MKKFFSHLAVPLTWTLFIQVLLCLPASSIPGMKWHWIPFMDKYVHIVLFGTFTSLWCYYFSCKERSAEKLRKIFLWVFLTAVANGTALEFIQRYFIPGRTFDGSDILANTAGAGIAWLICNIKLLKINS